MILNSILGLPIKNLMLRNYVTEEKKTPTYPIYNIWNYEQMNNTLFVQEKIWNISNNLYPNLL